MLTQETRAIDQIKIGDRIRTSVDAGIPALADSIKRLGLINPITINAEGMLIAGYRRLQAAKFNGMPSVDVHVIDTLGDMVIETEIEGEENLQRKQMTKSETAIYAATLASVKAEAATKRRESSTINKGPAPESGTDTSDETGDVRQLVGQELGLGKANAGEFVQIGRAALSDDPETRELGQAALSALDAGTNVRKVGADLRSKIPSARKPPTKKPAREPSRAPGQRRGITKACAALSGIAMGLDQIGELDPSITSAEAADWHGDLYKTRTVIERVIKRLKERKDSVAQA